MWRLARSAIPRRHLTSSAKLPAFVFNSATEYYNYLNEHHSRLPWGFSVGTTTFKFVPQEAPHLPAQMTLTLIKPHKPTPLFGAVFTQNACPGAPIKVGRKRLAEDTLGAIIVNNKISNVCANGGGVSDAQEVCDAVAQHLDLRGSQVLPSSTGVIGWRLPVEPILHALPNLVESLQDTSILPAAAGIMTTDLYPKIRSVDVCGGRIVGIAKGAGMVEPNMATMLSYILTDLAVPRDLLRRLLADVVDKTYNSMSVDTDESTSDTLAIVSSGEIPFDVEHLDEFRAGLYDVCAGLCEDIVRNGEGAHHVMQVVVKGAMDEVQAKGIGKSIVNSPLLKCAVAGNDPNVGRLVMAVGKYMGKHYKGVNVAESMTISMGGLRIFEFGEFTLNGYGQQSPLVGVLSIAVMAMFAGMLRRNSCST
ncbi:glutamate N-acetyltransferase/amino-acid acetyltransferase, variant 1 [Aphanomyces invadans]|uniref:Arginine biosynthesis bifunctional protein ArgJ, mitochondrial n=1 Tax=Aphanomyces invadans TaxID=157072 RepID=A0A024TGA9_9STRA|nr:glutamate N-acetyltransferase/amino-acid acetyltransferase, variant 1 [Aphanomyces invadans]ETV93200.1 glutamate N-acetyltransferase/amino-acid acetyltransferase, variant 1 [Aphanomyces invadans]|eukprot:XP_008878221.1 glutamate N-acetyltransferase/amino-acid acetyltransferase, variant 1 [Aphanomyces invadans]